MEIAAKTNRGRVRDRSEDNYLETEFDHTTSSLDASTATVTGPSPHHKATMILVADGMGGQAECDLTGETIVEHLARFAESLASAILASADAGDEIRELLSTELNRCGIQTLPAPGVP
jgi:serine/threonine protein phosphatase PrpC